MIKSSFSLTEAGQINSKEKNVKNTKILLNPKYTNSNRQLMNELSTQTINDMLDGDEMDTYKQIRLNKIVQNAIHWCLVSGFIVVPKGLTSSDLMTVTHLPFTLYPTPFKRKTYQKVVNLQPEINELMYKIANSKLYMEKNFKDLANTDKFIHSLWRIYQRSLKEGYNQKIFLQILRVDYMLHQSLDDIKQVEINTMASGMGYNSGRIPQLHKQILKWSKYESMASKMVENEPIKKIAQGFVEAWRMYNVKKAIILFIVLDWEVNLGDQRNTEYEIINQENNIEIQRCTLKEMHHYGHVDENKVLYFDNQEVAIVYFRAGYAPSHYESEKEWAALTMIELSKAIKCPNVATFLSGMKKIQEFLVHDTKALSDLCENDQTLVQEHRSVFAEFMKLDNQDDFERIFNNPSDFVLKPQREGGGNNFYNDEIKEMLSNMLDKREINDNEDEIITNKQRYIVMELLKPPITENVIVSSKSQQKLANTGNLVHMSKITNELGIFGVLVRNESEVILNETCGYLLRSKLAEDNEGGLMAGSGALDSIYLID